MEKRCLSLLLAVLTVLSLLVPVFAADDGPEVPAEASQSVEAAAPAEEAPAAVTAVSSDAEQLVEPAEETGSGSAMPGSGTDAGTSGTTGDVAWSFSDGTLRISGHGAMAEYRPDSAPEGSGQPWYVYRARIRNVVIDSGVTAVGAYAFSGCAALTSVELPDSVVRVSEGVFRDTGLRDIVVANAACAIRGDASSLGRPGVTIIHGCAGSAVQSYALAYGYQFAAIPGTVASPDKSGTAPAPEASTGTDAVPAPEDDGAASDAGVEAAAASETDAASVPDAQALPVPDAPELIGVTSAATGVTISWNSFPGAVKYRVFYKIGDGGWTKIADTTKTSYTWTKAKAGTEYTFTVRCVSKSGKSYTSNFDPVGVSYKLLATPSVTVTGGVDKVTVSWGTVSGAAKYRVFLKNGKNWETLADVAETSYTMAAASGKSYTFTVRCLDETGDYASGYNTKGKSIAYISTPVLSGVSSAATGVTVTWGKVPGAVKYRVFYKIGNGGWKKIADTTKTSYTWTKAKAGTEYTYTVRCVSKTGKSYTSNYDPVGVSYKLLAMPSVTVTGGVDKVTVSWGAVSGAAKYRVFLKTSKGWETLADVTETSYTMAAASGKSYTFTVRCLDETGDYASGYNTKGKSIAYISTPVLSGVSSAATGVTVTWGKVPGAVKYRVFYKIGDGGWKKIADTTKTSYTWTKAKAGTEYTYTVRCISKSGKSYTSNYDLVGVSYKLLATPAVSVAHGTDSVTVSWGAVSGAVKYRVFLKTSKGWETLADVSGTSYTMAAASGKSYTFTVRCIDAAGNYTSGYNTAGKTITFVEQPAISGVEAASSGVTVKWGKVSGAVKYRLFYKSGSGWTKIADTTKTSYTWSGAKSGTEYTFTVRCVSSDGKSFTSAYDQTGVRFCYVAAPTLTKVANVSGGFKLTWSAVGGAAKYRIYYQMDSGAWSQLAETGQTSYTMTGADSKAKYAFAVQAVSQTGTASVRSNTWKTMVFTNSPLVAYTRISPNRDKDRKNVIDTITIHCTAELWSVEKLGESFSPVSRKASSNYGIGTDGRVGMFVEEKDCSWCSSNRDNDNRAITIEVASGTSEPYAVTDEVYAVMIDLVTDICQRNGIEKLVWSTSKNERVNHLNGCNMTVHRDYANKSCPGTYLYERMGKIAAEVNARLAS